MKVLRYLFYKIYSYSLSNGQGDSIWAFGMVSLFTLINIYSILDAIILLIQIKPLHISKIEVICGSAIMICFNYFYFIGNGKDKLILDEFQNKKNKTGLLNLLLFLYIIVSIGTFIFTINIVREINLTEKSGFK